MKLLWSVIGTLSLLLGFLGLFLPVVPTTPFWLLTAYCYVRGSSRLYDRVMSIPVFCRVVENFRLYRAIPLRVKVVAVTTLWATIILSCCLVARLWVIVVLLFVGIGVTWHILSYKTLRSDN